MNKTDNQTGRSMVEILGVLAIIGVLSVGGIAGYSKAMAKFKLTKTQDQLQMMVMNIRTNYATSAGYIGLNNRKVIEYKLVDGGMVINSSELMSAMGGKVIVAAVKNLDNTTEAGFGISFSGLGRDACVSLATSDWGTDGMMGLWVTSTSDVTSSITNPNDLTSEHLWSPSKLPIPLEKARSLCDTDSKNKITWYYL